MQSKTLPVDPLLTEEQAANYLGLKPGTLQVWRSTKREPLAYVKIGRNVRYRRSALEQYVCEQTVSA